MSAILAVAGFLLALITGALGADYERDGQTKRDAWRILVFGTLTVVVSYWSGRLA